MRQSRYGFRNSVRTGRARRDLGGSPGLPSSDERDERRGVHVMGDTRRFGGRGSVPHWEQPPVSPGSGREGEHIHKGAQKLPTDINKAICYVLLFIYLFGVFSIG